MTSQLTLARRENKDIKSFLNCFGGEVTFDRDNRVDFDGERAWEYKGFTIVRTTEEYERKSIGRSVFDLVPVYQIYGWQSSGYSYWEPPDVWEVDMGKQPTILKALLEIDKLEREDMLRGYMEGEFWEQMIKDEESYQRD